MELSVFPTQNENPGVSIPFDELATSTDPIDSSVFTWMNNATPFYPDVPCTFPILDQTFESCYDGSDQWVNPGAGLCAGYEC